MFGDSKSAVDNSMTPNGKIHERYVALLFNWVRESIVSGMFTYQFVDGKHNPVDELSKHWGTL